MFWKGGAFFAVNSKLWTHEGAGEVVSWKEPWNSIVWTLMGKRKKLNSPPFSPCQQHSFSSVFSLTPPIIIIMCVIFIKLQRTFTHIYIWPMQLWKDGKERCPFLQMRTLSPKEINWCAQSTQEVSCRARATRSSVPEAITPFIC